MKPFNFIRQKVHCLVPKHPYSSFRGLLVCTLLPPPTPPGNSIWVCQFPSPLPLRNVQWLSVGWVWIFPGVTLFQVQGLLQATRGNCNPNLHSCVACIYPAFVWTSKNEWMLRKQFDLECLDLLSFIIWWRMFWPSVTWNLHKAQH